MAELGRKTKRYPSDLTDEEITASFASFFIGRDATWPKAETAGAAGIAQLREDITALRRDLAKRG